MNVITKYLLHFLELRHSFRTSLYRVCVFSRFLTLDAGLDHNLELALIIGFLKPAQIHNCVSDLRFIFFNEQEKLVGWDMLEFLLS